MYKIKEHAHKYLPTGEFIKLLVLPTDTMQHCLRSGIDFERRTATDRQQCVQIQLAYNVHVGYDAYSTISVQERQTETNYENTCLTIYLHNLDYAHVLQ